MDLHQWRRRGKTAGEAPEVRQIVVAKTILLPFIVLGVAIGYTKKCENLKQITTGARRCAADLLPRCRCRTIDGLEEFKLGDREINPFPDPDNIKFSQSPYIS